MFSKKSNTFILSLINPKILFMFCLKKSAKIVSFQNYFSIFFIIITINFYQCQQRHLDVKFPLQIVFTFLHNNNIITPANFPHQRRKFYKSYYQIDIFNNDLSIPPPMDGTPTNLVSHTPTQYTTCTEHTHPA